MVQNSFKDGAGLPSQEQAEERAEEGRGRAGMKERQQNKLLQWPDSKQHGTPKNFILAIEIYPGRNMKNNKGM